MEGESLIQVWDSGSGPIKEPEAWEEVLMSAVSSLASKGPELSLESSPHRPWLGKRSGKHLAHSRHHD